MVNVKLSHYLIGLIVFSMFVTGGVSLMLSFQAQDDTFINSTDIQHINKSFYVYDDLDAKVTDLKGNVESSGVDDNSLLGSILNVLDLFIMSIWGGIKVLASSFGFTFIFANISSFLGIPTWVGASITLMVTTFLVLIVIGLIFKRDL